MLTFLRNTHRGVRKKRYDRRLQRKAIQPFVHHTETLEACFSATPVFEDVKSTSKAALCKERKENNERKVRDSTCAIQTEWRVLK